MKKHCYNNHRPWHRHCHDIIITDPDTDSHDIIITDSDTDSYDIIIIDPDTDTAMASIGRNS